MSDTPPTLRDCVLGVGDFTVAFGDESEIIVNPGRLDVRDVARTVDTFPLGAFLTLPAHRSTP